jgi:hypothetical protein
MIEPNDHDQWDYSKPTPISQFISHSPENAKMMEEFFKKLDSGEIVLS